MPHADHHSTASIEQEAVHRIYSVCFFRDGFLVPDVKLIDASSDEEAIESARMNRSFTTREVWDRHRLVAVIPPGHH
jgi:hypothetical protein